MEHVTHHPMNEETWLTNELFSAAVADAQRMLHDVRVASGNPIPDLSWCVKHACEELRLAEDRLNEGDTSGATENLAEVLLQVLLIAGVADLGVAAASAKRMDWDLLETPDQAAPADPNS